MDFSDLKQPSPSTLVTKYTIL